MTTDPQIEAVQPFQLARLDGHRRDEISLWNWYSAVFPAVADWRIWLRDVAGHLLRQPGPSKVRVVKTNLLEAGQPAERVWLENPEFGIGRGPDNTVVLHEATITRNHARLRRDGDSVLLEDLGSAMGTIINGSKLPAGTSVELCDGDDFVIFPYRFRIEVEREWIPDTDAAISQTSCFPLAWAEFRDSCPAGWFLPALHVEPTGLLAYLAADEGFLRGLADRLLSPIEEDAPGWPPAAEGLIELLLLSVAERANRDLAFPFQFSLGRLARPPRLADHARGIAAAATLDLGGVRGAMRLFLPFDLLNGMRQRWSPRRPDGLARQATWRFAVSAGHVELNAREWNSIERGDVVLYAAEPALLLPDDDRAGWQVTWDGAARVCLTGRLDRRVSMPEKTDDGPATFQDLPLRVQILIDEHEMTLAQAELLAPGSVLDLNRDPREPVRLAVNGRVVGTVELVEIEGRLGVKILGWSNR
ncbi:MAG: FHA domain-containing protein [Candidatus Solibacter sp.]|nr:FHA domain-containing protein [Candidatus Solibacter sp.]